VPRFRGGQTQIAKSTGTPEILRVTWNCRAPSGGMNRSGIRFGANRPGTPTPLAVLFRACGKRNSSTKRFAQNYSDKFFLRV
jgi:hypothetical protein